VTEELTSMSVEEARAILLEIDRTVDLDAGTVEEQIDRYKTLTPRQQQAMEMDRWNSTGGRRKDSAGIEIRYDFTIRDGLRHFREVDGREVEGQLDQAGRFVPNS
jgi:hypothetical protein